MCKTTIRSSHALREKNVNLVKEWLFLEQKAGQWHKQKKL
jgi:hypothetical protein